MFGFLFFAAVVVVLAFKLNEILGQRIGFFAPKESVPPFEKAEDSATIAEVDQKIALVQKFFPKFNPVDFLNKSQKAFEMIFNAYSQGDLNTLKQLLSPRIYQAFALAISDRKSRGETLEGVLVRFVDSEIVESSDNDDKLFIEVKFVTEQSNVLRSAQGEILEGSLDFVKEHTDVWVFSHEKSSHDSRWYLFEIKSESD